MPIHEHNVVAPIDIRAEPELNERTPVENQYLNPSNLWINPMKD
jgi:hypothetical protein